MVKLAIVFCITLVELLVLDAGLVMGGVERDPFCYDFDCFYFLFRLGSCIRTIVFNMNLIYLYYLVIECLIYVTVFDKTGHMGSVRYSRNVRF